MNAIHSTLHHGCRLRAFFLFLFSLFPLHVCESVTEIIVFNCTFLFLFLFYFLVLQRERVTLFMLYMMIKVATEEPDSISSLKAFAFVLFVSLSDSEFKRTLSQKRRDIRQQN